MTTNRGDAMTAQELTDAEQEIVAAFEAAPYPAEVADARLAAIAARAQQADDGPRDIWLRS
jgi:hypothetical protein